MPAVPGPWRGSTDPEAVACIQNVIWSQMSPGFPDMIVFKASAERWQKFSEQRLGPARTNASPFPDGFDLGRYKATEWTNIEAGGSVFRIPRESRVEWFWPSTHSKGSFLNESEIFYVTEASIGRQTLPVPSLPPQEVSVLDWRFVDEAYPQLSVAYAITNRVWRTKNDPNLQPLIAEFRIQYDDIRLGKVLFAKPAENRISPTRRFVILLVCVGTLILPLAAFLFRGSRDKLR
jgi:hypothetical protein